MGYDRRGALTIYKLDLGAQFPGLVVRCYRPSLLAERTLAEAAPLLQAADTHPRERLGAEVVAAAALGDSLHSWTLLDRGRPVPANRAGLLGQDREFVLMLITVWGQHVLADRPAATVAPLMAEVPGSAPAPPTVDGGEHDDASVVLHDIPTLPLADDATPAERADAGAGAELAEVS